MAGNGPKVRVEHPNRSIYLNTEITVNHENLAEQNSSPARQFTGTFLRQITDRLETFHRRICRQFNFMST